MCKLGVSVRGWPLFFYTPNPLKGAFKQFMIFNFFTIIKQPAFTFLITVKVIIPLLRPL